MRLGGQVRVASGLSARLLGWDMTAAFHLADALGVDRAAVGVLLPEIEAAAFSAINRTIAESESGE